MRRKKYFYLFKCTKKKKMALARDPAGVRSRCAGLPRALVTVGIACLCLGVASWFWG